MIDTHCHLIDPQFKHDIDAVCERARRAGIHVIVNAGYDPGTSRSACVMHESAEWILPAVGIHPNESAGESIKQMKEIEVLAKRTDVIAIGETGLDYYRDRSPRDAQQELFKMHIRIASDLELPLLIHTRNSIDDAIVILKAAARAHGVFHCFSGTYDQAQEIMAMGFYLGFGGVLTFSRQCREVFEKIPIERVVMETDAPFLAPASHRGKRNEPSYLKETLDVAAGIHDRPSEYVEQITDENARTLFSLR
jgi:TatD DNase family protein